MARRQRRSRREWQRLIGELKGSGLTQQEFAAGRHLNSKTLENWAYRLRREARQVVAPVRFVPIEVRAASAPGAASPTSTPAEAVIELVVGETVRVRFAPGVDCDYLGRLVAAVTRSAAC